MSAPESAPESAAERNGRIVTFYSYKGGTGRSMAVANVAWILASHGQRVLAIDWDLEAPGLHRYFHPFMTDPRLASSPGIIDFLSQFVEAAHDAGTLGDGRWFAPFVDLEPFSFSLDWPFGAGTLDVVPAGQQGPGYAARVMSFDWSGFYTTLGGGVFLEAVKARLRQEYDWILVDSRTGISDTAGVCTVQLPDDLVVCFTLNEQSISGASAVARSAVAQRRKPDGSPGLRAFPLRTRVERAETERLNAAKDAAQEAFGPLLEHMAESERLSYWSAAEVPYLPFYAYEEVLAAFGDPAPIAGSMLASMETLTRYVTDGRVTRLPPIPVDARAAGLAKFLRRAPARHATTALPEFVPHSFTAPTARPTPAARVEPAVTPPPAPRAAREWKHLAFVSYAHTDASVYLDRFLDDFRKELDARLPDAEHSLFVDRERVDTSGEWSPAIREAIEGSRFGVCLYSPAYFASEQCGREFAFFTERSSQGLGALTSSVMPVMWERTRVPLPRAASAVQYVDASMPERYASEGLLYLIRSSGRRGAYFDVVEALVDRLVRATRVPAEPPAHLPDLDEMPNAFADAEPTLGGRRVYVSLGVADASAMAGARRDVACYGRTPRDWSPLGGERLWTIVGRAAAAEAVSMQEAPFTPSLVETVRRAEAEAAPVLVFVDPWSLELPGFAETLDALAERPHPNLAVLIVWNETDPETTLARPRLAERVERSTAGMVKRGVAVIHPRFDSEAAIQRLVGSALAIVRTQIVSAAADLPGVEVRVGGVGRYLY